LIKIIGSDEYQVIPKTRKNEILSFLKDAKDISFSRPKKTLPWGIPVPGDDYQVMYVWCDALSNYITGVGYGRDEKNFKKHWPAKIHIIGKDILRFHAAFWPAMLLSAKLELPKKLFVHGFILSKGTKMGKSMGNVIDPNEQIKKYGVDSFRYYIIGAMPIDGDGEYSEDILRERINNELVANLGNFCYRTLNFLNKNFDGKISEIDGSKELIEELNRKTEETKNDYENFKLNEALRDILHISSLGNKYFQENEPWRLIKEDREKAHKILGLCVNIVKNLSILISPIMPDFSKKLQDQLSVKDLSWKDINFELKNHKIGREELLVKKVEQKDSKEKFSLNLKVAKIIEVNDHPDADKLYVLQLDLGEEKRQLVAGLKGHYTKEELKDKKIIVVTNLKYAKLRGVESQGMLLAGDDGKSVGVLTCDKSWPGDSVFVDGLENSEEKIKFEDFQKIRIEIKNGNALFDGKKLKTQKENVKSEKVGDGARVR
jgi:methionyl-tRNA synthetase